MPTRATDRISPQGMHNWPAILAVALAYLLGGIPFALLLGRLRGVDIRRIGSGNIGATNLTRALGKPWGITAFILDFLKGLAPVLLFQLVPWPPRGQESELSQVHVQILCGLAAILGHVFSVWAKFKGGKGVATSAGVFIGLAPVAVLLGLGVWLVVVFATRIVSLASIAAAVALPFVVWLGPGEASGSLLIFAVALGIFVVWAHRSNVGRLMRGEEKRFSRADPTGGEA